MKQSLIADVPAAAHAKAVSALDDFDALVASYEMLLDTQQVLVSTSNFGALFEMASRGDRLARDASLCSQRFAPLVDAIVSGQFSGPRATEIKRKSFAARSRAETLSASSASLARACGDERDIMARELRKTHPGGGQAGLPPAYRTDSVRVLDRRG
jgi:hypothetical protein